MAAVTRAALVAPEAAAAVVAGPGAVATGTAVVCDGSSDDLRGHHAVCRRRWLWRRPR